MSESRPYTWAKQKIAEGCEEFDCPAQDPIKDFIRDPSGYYVLIRVDLEKAKIEVGVCDKDHNVVRIFRGSRAQNIYAAIFVYEKKQGLEFFQEKTHSAYLGKELKKAEIALAMGSQNYYQE